MWYPAEQGQTIGQTGSENGRILADEEYRSSCRITLEEGGYIAPYSITCGIYGRMVHTVFARDRSEAEENYAQIKQELSFAIDSEDRKSTRLNSSH